MWTTIDPELLSRLKRKPIAGSSSWSDAMAVLDQFEKEYTEGDWDGQGAEAIPYEVIDSARELANRLELLGIGAPTGTLPGFDSSLAFEWEYTDGAAVEVEVKTPKDLCMTARSSDKKFERLSFVDKVDAREAATR